MDAYWAKDIQELFRLERRQAFQRFVELMLARSGGMFGATAFARPCEVSRTTIANYLNVLEATGAAYVLRPFSARRTTEVVAAPKVYGFDTGFVCYYRGWDTLREDDLGFLWEHLVLNELLALLQTGPVHYWRDKAGHEVDFVVKRRGEAPPAIACKWSADGFRGGNLRAFRTRHPEGENRVLCQDVDRAYVRDVDRGPGDLRKSPRPAATARLTCAGPPGNR